MGYHILSVARIVDVRAMPLVDAKGQGIYLPYPARNITLQSSHQALGDTRRDLAEESLQDTRQMEE